MTAQPQPPAAPSFDQRMMDVLNHGALALMVSLGHRSGLFDVLARTSPTTLPALASAARLSERYVREWLGAMVTGGIVIFDPDSGTYALPPEHAAFLTREGSPNNLAAFMQYIPLLGGVEDAVLAAFRDGRGVPYSAYPRFQEVMAEDSAQTVVAALHEYILPLMPGLKERLEAGIDVLDVGCGQGRALRVLAASFPRSRFTGLDMSEGGIEAAQSEASGQGLSNVRFEVGDAAELDAREAYDFITAFDAIHDQARPQQVLRNIRAALRRGGVFLMQDIHASSEVEGNLDHPAGPFLYTISTMHCLSVSLAGGGPGLGAMWGRERARSMLEGAGFTEVRIEQLAHDFQNDYYIAS